MAPAALLQLASRKEVFVVDLMALVPGPQVEPQSGEQLMRETPEEQQGRHHGHAGYETPDHRSHTGVHTDVYTGEARQARDVREARGLSEGLHEVLRQLFASAHVRKLGFASRGDLDRLEAILPGPLQLVTVRYSSLRLEAILPGPHPLCTTSVPQPPHLTPAPSPMPLPPTAPQSYTFARTAPP